MSNNNQNLRSEAEELVSELESIDGIKNGLVDDFTDGCTEVHIFAYPKDNANLRSVSQLVRNRLKENDTFNIMDFKTPSEAIGNYYDIDMTIF